MAAEDLSEEEIASSSAHPWRRSVQHVLCKCCGYEPPAEAAVPVQCPKCYGGAWDRFVWRGKLRPPQSAVPRKPSRPRATPRAAAGEPATTPAVTA